MSGGGVVQVHVLIPNSVYFYNHLMGGGDLPDLSIQCHETQRQVHKYLKTLFFYCINITVSKSYFLYKDNLLVAQQSRYDYKRLVAELVKCLS